MAVFQTLVAILGALLEVFSGFGVICEFLRTVGLVDDCGILS